MKKVIIALAAALTLCSQGLQAENGVKVMPATLSAGLTSNDAAYLSFEMTNEQENIIGLEFKVKLPDGMEFDDSRPAEAPAFELVLNPRFPFTRGRTEKTYQHAVKYSKQSDGYWHILIYSSQLTPIKDLSGEILRGRIVTDANLADGTYPVEIKETILGISGTEKAETAATTTSYVDVGAPFLLGDVNNSRDVTPADAIMILYHYFGVKQNGFNLRAADVNRDTKISPADAIEALYIYFGAGKNGNGVRATETATGTAHDPE